MRPLAFLLWFWLAASISVYGYRLYRRMSKGPKTSGAGQDSSAPDPSPSDRPAGAATALINNPVAGFDSAPPIPGPPTIGTDVSGPDTPDVAMVPPTESIAPAAPAPPAWGAPSAGVGDTAPSATPSSERRVPRQPISDAVAGIQMPCDLTPLLGDATSIDPFDVAFSTTTHDSDGVRAALAGELVRLGFQVAPTSPVRLTASRADTELMVSIYQDPTNATEGGRSLYPTVGLGSVVVRLQS